jgi:ribonuclease E
MMTTRMLIDARHSEETRVAVLKGNRIEEFDFESAEHKQIKGNIYLAKVTRVEPSLQAAFVDFGGNRHGFLAFSEIHPDYYQIPKDDRDRLLAEEAAHAEEEAALRAAEDIDDYGESALDRMGDDDGGEMGEGPDGIMEIDGGDRGHVATIEGGQVQDDDQDDGDGQDDDDDGEEDSGNDEGGDGEERSQRRGRRRQGGRSRSKEADELRAKRMALRRRYKIQDVIHRRQVLLVQVVKEERGNKGAALTTYLSLAGRYCVLMPNSSHGGGISRKINSASDRKRLKGIIAELNLPRTMGCIVRTAGLQRTKTEIKRDFDYLARLWDEIRETTLGSSAPALIHSDSDLIKRAIRDIYNKEIEDVVVEGEAGYRAARDFMKLLMPSHVKRVKAYSDPVPLFQRHGAEDQLTAMYDPFVQLKSGGYIVINPTEALVSIDINSGRSTKEYGIEATALNTNLEAAREIARQLRLRDMAGLVVIDFIDMEYSSNIRKVEKAMKEALKNDRARIQVGRISGFGLMEMSRQRLRTGVLEATTRTCPHCDGTGLVRTASSSALSALRLIEDEAARGKGSTITLCASQEAAIYLLNHKRADLAEIESLYGVRVEVIPEGENEGAKMRVASSGPRNDFVPRFGPIVLEDDGDEPEIEDEIDDEDEDTAEDRGSREDGDGSRGRRGRRRGGRGRRDEREPREARETTDAGEDDAEEDRGEGGERTPRGDDAGEDGEGPRKRRRRGRRRRGGRGRGEGGEGTESENGQSQDEGSDDGRADAEPVEAEAESAAEMPSEVEAPSEPAPKKRSRRKAPAATDEVAVEVAAVEVAGSAPSQASAESDAAAEPAAKPKRTRRKAGAAKDDAAEAVTHAPTESTPAAEAEAPASVEPAPAKPARSRRKKADAPVDAEPEASQSAVPEAAAIPEPAIIEAELADVNSDEPAERDEPEANGPPRKGWWQRTFG